MDRCQFCGEKAVEAHEEKNYTTQVAGISLQLDEAMVGRCTKCGRENYALRKDIWLMNQETEHGGGHEKRG